MKNITLILLTFILAFASGIVCAQTSDRKNTLESIEFAGGVPCYNQTETFFNICTGIDYTFPDGTTQTILSHTEYTSTLLTVDGLCDSVILTILNTTDLTIAVTVSGNTLTAQQGNAGYQWLDCDNGLAPINGANNQTYSAISGNFAVIIFKGNCTDTSACYQVGTVGINDINANDVYVYPNPTNGLFKIKLGATYNEVNVIIRNVMGQVVFEQNLHNTNLFDAHIESSAGMYFMELQGSQGLSVSYKIIMK